MLEADPSITYDEVHERLLARQLRPTEPLSPTGPTAPGNDSLAEALVDASLIGSATTTDDYDAGALFDPPPTFFSRGRHRPLVDFDVYETPSNRNDVLADDPAGPLLVTTEDVAERDDVSLNGDSNGDAVAAEQKDRGVSERRRGSWRPTNARASEAEPAESQVAFEAQNRRRHHRPSGPAARRRRARRPGHGGRRVGRNADGRGGRARRGACRRVVGASDAARCAPRRSRRRARRRGGRHADGRRQRGFARASGIH